MAHWKRLTGTAGDQAFSFVAAFDGHAGEAEHPQEPEHTRRLEPGREERRREHHDHDLQRMLTQPCGSAVDHHQQLGDHSFNAALVDKYGLTDYLARRFAIVGPPEVCRERLQELGSFGVTNVTISLLSQDLPGQMDTMRRLADQVFSGI